MRRYLFTPIVFAVLGTLAFAQETAPPPPAPQAFQPGMADLMTMLVAPRHAKLYYAGTARNWELAAFELRQLRSALRRTVGTVPMYLDRDVNETIDAMLGPTLLATENAIAAGDSRQFDTAFENLTASCNACHTYLEHPFLVVRTPAAGARNAYPNQRFEPRP